MSSSKTKNCHWRFWLHADDLLPHNKVASPVTKRRLCALIKHSVLFLDPLHRFLVSDAQVIDNTCLRMLLRDVDKYDIHPFFRGDAKNGYADSCFQIATRFNENSGFPHELQDIQEEKIKRKKLFFDHETHSFGDHEELKFLQAYCCFVPFDLNEVGPDYQNTVLKIFDSEEILQTFEDHLEESGKREEIAHSSPEARQKVIKDLIRRINEYAQEEIQSLKKQDTPETLGHVFYYSRLKDKLTPKEWELFGEIIVFASASVYHMNLPNKFNADCDGNFDQVKYAKLFMKLSTKNREIADQVVGERHLGLAAYEKGLEYLSANTIFELRHSDEAKCYFSLLRNFDGDYKRLLNAYHAYIRRIDMTIAGLHRAVTHLPEENKVIRTRANMIDAAHKTGKVLELATSYLAPLVPVNPLISPGMNLFNHFVLSRLAEQEKMLDEGERYAMLQEAQKAIQIPEERVIADRLDNVYLRQGILSDNTSQAIEKRTIVEYEC